MIPSVFFSSFKHWKEEELQTQKKVRSYTVGVVLERQSVFLKQGLSDVMESLFINVPYFINI